MTTTTPSRSAGLFAQLEDRFREIADLGAAAGLLGWDQETYLPPAAGAIRGRQFRTISGVIHQRATDPALGRLLDDLGNGENAELSALQNRAVREMRRDFDLSTKIPEALVRDMAEATTNALEVWKKARKKNDFAMFAPALKPVVDLTRRKAEYLAAGRGLSLYDALLDTYEPGMKSERVATIFAGVRDRTVRLLERIKGAVHPPTADILHRRYPDAAQWDATMAALRTIGFDFDRGRQDRSAHPFTGGSDPTDVRLTTRVDENYLPTSFFSALHEGGHGLYEQGLSKEKVGDILASATSLGIHESQSRLWENLVGRSRGFWQFFYPKLRDFFPEVLRDVEERHFWRAANVVEPSLIRVEADEVTYNLHIILRFEMERDMMEGRLEVDRLPAVWNEKMEAYLGVVPPTDADGCMQDVHWSHGLIGYFPTYSLGNIYSVPFYRAAEKVLGGDLQASFARGEFVPLRDWLRREIHAYGRSETAEEIAQRVTGSPLDPGPYMDYLEAKVASVYGLSS
jgi:carboxypeptidase Taq